MGLIQSRQLVFSNVNSDGRIEKVCTSKIRNYIDGYLNRYDDVDIDTLDEAVAKIQLSIDGHFSQISDTDIGMEFYEIMVSATGVEVSKEIGGQHLETISLLDMKELLLAWKQFLLTPPLSGTKVSSL